MTDRFVDEIRAVLRDATNHWHLESGREMTRKYRLLHDGDRAKAHEALDRLRVNFSELRQIFQKVK